SIGVITMKMISNTSTTSTRGVTLMSFLGPGSCLGPCMTLLRTREEVDDLGLDRVDVGVQLVDAPVEVVVHPHRRDGDDEAEGRHDERLGDAAGHLPQPALPRGTHLLERADDAD